MARKAEYLTGFLAKTFPKIAFGVGVVFLILSFVLGYPHHHDSHLFFSYLMSFSFFTTIALGSLFFVVIQFLVRAGWSVVIRRIPEFVMKNIWVMALLFLPLLLGLHDLYHWTHVDAVAHDAILSGKMPYLNIPFFVIRAFVFFGIWIWLSFMFFRKSVFQDQFKAPYITLKLQKYATFSVLLYALSQTFAFIDWVMSITPHWYSTMFGVYFFAGSAVASIATMLIILLTLRKAGFLANVVNVEHYHDLGKLLYGFNVFWTYIAFSQYFLIWYANIPEETIWFAQHFNGSWNNVAIFLAVGHFVVPFILFMSRHVKRNLNTNLMMAVWILFMHLVDIYWIIMPNATPAGLSISLLDVTTFIGIGGIFIGALYYRMSRYSLYAYQDPRLEESVHFKNA